MTAYRRMSEEVEARRRMCFKRDWSDEKCEKVRSERRKEDRSEGVSE